MAKEAADRAQPWGQWLRERITRRTAGTIAYEQAVEKVANQTLGKSAKIQTSLDAIMLQSIGDIARDENDDIRAFKARHVKDGNVRVGGPPNTGGDNRDVIVADHMEFHYPQNDTRRSASPLLVGLLAAAAGAAGMYAWPRINAPEPVPSTPVSSLPGSDPAPGVVKQTAPQIEVEPIRLRVRWKVDQATGVLKTEATRVEGSSTEATETK